MAGFLWFATVTSFLAGPLVLVQGLIFPPAISKASFMAILPPPTASPSIHAEMLERLSKVYTETCHDLFKTFLSHHLQDQIWTAGQGSWGSPWPTHPQPPQPHPSSGSKMHLSSTHIEVVWISVSFLSKPIYSIASSKGVFCCLLSIECLISFTFEHFSHLPFKFVDNLNHLFAFICFIFTVPKILERLENHSSSKVGKNVKKKK